MHGECAVGKVLQARLVETTVAGARSEPLDVELIVDRVYAVRACVKR
jgi:hypothetical protein